MIEYVEKQASRYRSNNVILTMGEDFHYTSAAINFRSMDKLIKLVHSVPHNDFYKKNFFGFTPFARIQNITIDYVNGIVLDAIPI